MSGIAPAAWLAEPPEYLNAAIALLDERSTKR